MVMDPGRTCHRKEITHPWESEPVKGQTSPMLPMAARKKEKTVVRSDY